MARNRRNRRGTPARFAQRGNPNQPQQKGGGDPRENSEGQVTAYNQDPALAGIPQTQGQGYQAEYDTRPLGSTETGPEETFPSPDSSNLGQPIHWEGTPGSQNAYPVEPRPAKQGELTSDILHQYVADGRYQSYTNWTRTLAFAIDDISRDFGDDIYDRMMLDPDVGASINTFKAGVLEDGLVLAPRIEDKTDKYYDDAVEIYEAAERMFDDDRLESPIDTRLWNLADACIFGNKVAEPKWALGSLTDSKTGYVLQDVKVKPRRSTAFAVDTFMDVKGILGLVPGIGIPVLVGTILTRPDRQPNLLARNRFMIHTFRPIDSDPRGSSIARAAFTPWNLKQQLWGEFLKWLTQFASPSIIGVLSENATPDVMRDSNGNVILGPDGKPVTIEPADLLATALASLKNSTALALAPGTEVTPIEMRGQGAPFITAFRFLSEQIATAILHQTLTTQSAKYGTKAQASVHQDVLMTLIRQAKASLIGCIRRDLLRNWIRWNWGEYPADYLIPRVSLGYTEQQDFATELTAISGAYSTGFLDDSQKPGLDRRLQLPTRRPLSEEEIAQQRMGQGDTVPIPGQPIPGIDPLNKAMQKVSGVAVPKPTAAPPPPPAQRRAA